MIPSTNRFDSQVTLKFIPVPAVLPNSHPSYTCEISKDIPPHHEDLIYDTAELPILHVSSPPRSLHVRERAVNPSKEASTNLSFTSAGYLVHETLLSKCPFPLHWNRSFPCHVAPQTYADIFIPISFFLVFSVHRGYNSPYLVCCMGSRSGHFSWTGNGLDANGSSIAP